MKLIIIFGPQAVGKMTVGQELEKITGLKLFHNHMTMDVVAPFFDFGTPTFRRLVRSFRLQMFKAVAKSNLEGMIFTYAWAFNKKSDAAFIDRIVRLFKSEGGTAYYVELEADVKERLKRNKSSRRLKHKPTKRNLGASEKSLLEYDEKYILNTRKGEFARKNYLKINNTKLSAAKTAKMIKAKFGL